ncbi:hypothetical protein Lesp02_55740 [Lentzea sp. NBRC 105346]|uniref:hypothetical protein n=1 Tax=Lentzea sp. NBRC 105346 TaxID=3032205 RepID=UPI0024A22E81|nr:hypothetical protein [Lentzea sp. NBRC 105346]GLZ33386.1 hypothetical protein Lesp02_55740 [Lentzea sp. NBRC 105346]
MTSGFINPDNPAQRKARERAHNAGTYHVVPRQLYLTANGLQDAAIEIRQTKQGLSRTFLNNYGMGILGEESGARGSYNDSVTQVLDHLDKLVQAAEDAAVIMQSVAQHYVNADDEQYRQFGHIDAQREAPRGAPLPRPNPKADY